MTTINSPIAEPGIPQRESHINSLDSRMGAPAMGHAGEHVKAGSTVDRKDIEMSGNAQEGDESGPSHTNSGRLSWKWTTLFWLIYITEGVVMGILYHRGEGRVVFIESTLQDSECIEGEGNPILVFFFALRLAAAVYTQNSAFLSQNSGLLMPHEATFLLVREWLHWAWQLLEKTDVYFEYFHDNSVCAIVECCLCPYAVILAGPPSIFFFFYTFLPVVVNSLALCVFLENFTCMLWFTFTLFVVGCCIAPCTYAWRDGGHDAKKTIRTLLILDSLVVGVFTVWGNYVQSGAIALVFGAVPVLNLEYALIILGR